MVKCIESESFMECMRGTAGDMITQCKAVFSCPEFLLLSEDLTAAKYAQTCESGE